MKTLKIVIAFCLITGAIVAQPNTGQTTYAHGTTVVKLSSGTYVYTDPGFIMAGYRASGNDRLVIDKVDVDGLYNGSVGEIMNQYSITTGGSNCNMSQTVSSNCAGVSIIETFQGSTQYAVAAGLATGCLIFFIDNTGAITTSTFYPYSATAAVYSKPLITESTVNPGRYYIVGSYWKNNREYMYVIYTDNNFSGGWTAQYDLGASTILTPRAIIEDSYVATGELIIVGRLDLGGADVYDGFMIALDNASSGTVNFAYRYYLLTGTNDWLSSVQLANANSGYIVGGYTDLSAGGERAWMQNINSTGGLSGGWGRIIQFNSVAAAGDVVSVLERYNTSSAYEYYGLAKTGGNGMLVCKLAANGNPSANESEFWYHSGSTFDESVSLSLNSAGGNLNEGLHVFGNTNGSPNEFLLMQSCFNGVSGSSTPPTLQFTTSVNASIGITTNSASINLNISSGLTPCSNYSITAFALTTTPTQPAGYVLAALPFGTYLGNNNKTAQYTFLKNNGVFENIEMSIFPNPADNVLKIKVSDFQDSKYSIEILNALGQILYQKKDSKIFDDKSEFDLDLTTLNLQDGIYILKISGGSDIKTTNFIVSHK